MAGAPALGLELALDPAGVLRVTFPGAPEGGARADAPIGEGDVGREVALMFEASDPARPLVMGLMHTPGQPRRPEATADGDRLEFTAEKEIVLLPEAAAPVAQAGDALRVRVRVEHEAAHAVTELRHDGVRLVRGEPALVGVRHRVVGGGEHDLVEPPRAQGGATVAGALGGRRDRVIVAQARGAAASPGAAAPAVSTCRGRAARRLGGATRGEAKRGEEESAGREGASGVEASSNMTISIREALRSITQSEPRTAYGMRPHAEKDAASRRKGAAAVA